MAPSSVTKPPVTNNFWADSASPGADLETPADGFISTGWPLSSIPPARGIMNWVKKYVMQGVRNWMQRGLPAWDAADVYTAGAVVYGPDNLHYLATGTPTLGTAPASDLTNWTLLIGGADQDRNTMCQWKGPVTWDGTTAVFSSVIVSNPNSNFRFTVTAQTITPGANKLIGWFKLHRTMTADVAASVGGSETSTTTALQAISTNSTALTDSFYAIAAVTNAGVLVLREGVSLSGAAGDTSAQNPTTGRTWKQPIIVAANGGAMARFEDRNGDLVSMIDSLGLQNGGRVMDFQEDWLDAPTVWAFGGYASPDTPNYPAPFGRWVAVHPDITGAPDSNLEGEELDTCIVRVGQRAGLSTGCALRFDWSSGAGDPANGKFVLVSKVPLVSQSNDALWVCEWAYELAADLTTTYGSQFIMGLLDSATPPFSTSQTYAFPFAGTVSVDTMGVSEKAPTGFWIRRVDGSAVWHCAASVNGSEHSLSANAGAGVGATTGVHRVRVEYVGLSSYDGTNNVWRIYIDDTLVAGGPTSSTTGLPQSHALSFVFGIKPSAGETNVDRVFHLLPLQIRSRRHRGIGNF